MINALNSQGFYTNFTQGTSQNTALTLEFQNLVESNLEYQRKDYKANMEKVCDAIELGKIEADLNMQIYSKSQSILGEVSQSRYERTLKSLLILLNALHKILHFRKQRFYAGHSKG